ncbi:MAG: flagellar protein FlaG [Gammaproteobacteria bacterium]
MTRETSVSVDTGGQVVATERLAAVRSATAERVEVSQEAVERVVSELKDYVQNSRRNLDFQVDDVTGRVVVKVIDSNSDTVIRQIPSEELLALSRRLADSLQDARKGMLLEIKA